MSIETQLTVEHLGKSTPNGVILSDVTFSIPKKGIHGLLAPKKGGKTSLLKILAGWDDAFEGDVILGEKSLREDSIARKRKIGFVPVKPALDPSMTVEETVLFAGQAKGVPSGKRIARMNEAMELLSLEEVRYRLCVNLNLFERQKVAMAIALIGNPKLLLLDSPTEALPRSEAEEMWELIRTLGRVKTLLIATDRYEEAILCEDIIFMADGRILAAGTVAELEEQLARSNDGNGMSLSEVYASLCRSSKEESK
ncbi:MAG: ABC transporter ATP-binding protein [Clostridia bacterium]|nr:ABC transporter ATP-binding protein [Clostridia bacterium]